MMDAKKGTIESMSREELISKYKGLLGIAKQAKKAKDEFAEENQKLKDQVTNCETQREADKQALLTMKEMLEEFTKNKLEMTSEISELREKNKLLVGEINITKTEKETMSIENEALRRQVNRLTEDNESLLTDIDQMEQQLKQVNVLGIEQKEHLNLLELEVEKLKEYEFTNKQLKTEIQDLEQSNETIKADLTTLSAKYKTLKEINSEQRSKFNSLRERFIEVNKKLKQLKECKRILLESHREYAESISRWQLEIMQASEQLCTHIQSLTNENTELKNEIQTMNGVVSITLPQLPVLIEYCEKAIIEYRRQNEVIEELTRKNKQLQGEQSKISDEVDHAVPVEEVELIKANYLQSEEINNKIAHEVQSLQEENFVLKEELDILKVEKLNLEKSASSTKLKLEEELHCLESLNRKLKEEALAADPNCEDIINTLKSQNHNLTEELGKLKVKEEDENASQKLLDQLQEKHLPKLIENCEIALHEYKKQKELVNTLTIQKDEDEKIIETLKRKLDDLEIRNKKLLDEEFANQNLIENFQKTHIPMLIDTCERALREHKLQKELLDKLTSSNCNKIDAIDTMECLKHELDDLKMQNETLTEKLSKAKQNEAAVQDVLKLKNNLTATAQTCEDLQTKIEKQERENADLLNEMRELNEALKGRGDVISKQQAKHQELLLEMKKTSTALEKMEANLAAKENLIKEKELKMVKMSEDNKSALQEVNRLQNISRENDSRIKMLSDEIASMRLQMENHDAQSETLSTSTISRTEELTRLREVDESFEEKYNKLRSLAVKLKKKSHEQSLCIAELEKQSAESKTKTADSTERINCLENEREALQKELKTCKNQIESLKVEVEKLKVSKKQSNVLNLEIEAFEKSLNETSAKLTAKISECDRLREALESKEISIETLKMENKILEESKESETIHGVELKKQIDKLQTQLKDAVHNKQEVCSKLEECLAEKQSLQSDLDELNQRMVSLLKERDTERTASLKEKESLNQRISSLESELTSSHNRITLAERSYQDLHQEYSNYKVKAQSVLRQNQSKESSKERELEEELTLLKGEHKELSNQLQEMVEKLHINEKSIEELEEEKRILHNRTSELMSTITDLRQQTNFLSQENKKQLETYQETLKTHRLQIEALESCHLQQLQDAQSKYDREITELKAISRKNPEAPLQKPLEKLDYILMEREDAEGSEAETTNTSKYLPSRKRSNHDLVPLDELLSSPIVDSSYAVLERRQSISPSIELQETKDRLHKEESRVRHLTSLLAESEQDVAKLTQLTEMLKEDIRRLERTFEREKHMHNSEYLKNIVLKFISLGNGDERSRLIPVLNTILKLSPSETEMLQNIAKGKALDNNNRSWSNFLPHWNTS